MAGVESRNLAHSRHGAQGAHGRRGTWGLGTRQAWSPGAWHTAGREPGGLAHGRRGTRGHTAGVEPRGLAHGSKARTRRSSPQE